MRMLIRARNAEVAVERGRIVPVEGRFDLELEAPRYELRPGLINAHDHLHRNHYGRLGRPPYRNAYDWAHDIQRRHRRRIASRQSLPRRTALLVGAWKNLFAGVTSVVHHDRWELDFEREFPIRVLPIASADSIGMSPAIERPKGAPFCLHVAEGVDQRAASEIDTLERRGLLDRWLLAVHGVGIDGEGVERFRAAGSALVWCPTSNRFLFGKAVPRALLGDDIDVLLGSDSYLTGDGDLLDELRAAHALRLIAENRLEAAVGERAAVRLGVARPSLEPGARADLILLRAPLLKAAARDVRLVIANGVPRLASNDLARKLAPRFPGGQAMAVRGVRRWANARAVAA